MVSKQPAGLQSAVYNPQQQFDYFYKIIIIGDENVGKTNLLLNISNRPFNPNPREYNGVEFEFKTINLPNSNQRVRAQIWDTPGAREF
jgi:Ras-related protein Rab-11A